MHTDQLTTIVKAKADKLYFDYYQIAELYTIYDAYAKEKRMYDKMLLWQFVQKCFPKYKLVNYQWVFCFKNPLSPFIWIRRIKDD